MRKVALATQATPFQLTIMDGASQRRLLLDSMVAVCEGRLDAGRANAIASLSAEVHKSLRLTWDAALFAAKHFELGAGNQVVVVDD